MASSSDTHTSRRSRRPWPWHSAICSGGLGSEKRNSTSRYSWCQFFKFHIGAAPATARHLPIPHTWSSHPWPPRPRHCAAAPPTPEQTSSRPDAIPPPTPSATIGIAQAPMDCVVVSTGPTTPDGCPQTGGWRSTNGSRTSATTRQNRAPQLKETPLPRAKRRSVNRLNSCCNRTNSPGNYVESVIPGHRHTPMFILF